MKQVKLNLMAIVGMMVAVGTVAFTAPKEKINANLNAEQQWYYTGSSQSSLDLNNSSNYELFDPEDHGVACEGTTQKLCSIMAPEDESTGKPLLETTVSIDAIEYSPTRRVN